MIAELWWGFMLLAFSKLTFRLHILILIPLANRVNIGAGDVRLSGRGNILSLWFTSYSVFRILKYCLIFRREYCEKVFETEPELKLASLRYIKICFWWWGENLGGCAFLCLPALLILVGSRERCCSSQMGEPFGRRCISWVINSRFRNIEPSGFVVVVF